MTGFGPVHILDVGPKAVGIRHEAAAERGSTTWLEFSWAGRILRLDCEVRTSRKPRAENKFRTGLAVIGGLGAEEYRYRVEEALAGMKVARR